VKLVFGVFFVFDLGVFIDTSSLLFKLLVGQQKGHQACKSPACMILKGSPLKVFDGTGLIIKGIGNLNKNISLPVML